MVLNRRRLLEGLLVGFAGLVLPISARARPWRLTEMDRIVMDAVYPTGNMRGWGPLEGAKLVRLEIHRLLYERMSLQEVDQVRIDVATTPPTENGYISYYSASYQYHDSYGVVQRVGRRTAGVGCYLRACELDEWIERNSKELRAP